MEYMFWFCLDDIKCCMNDKKKKYVLVWPIVLNTWLVNRGTNLSREEVLALENIGFQM